MAGGVRRRMSRWKENIRKLRKKERYVNLAYNVGFQKEARSREVTKILRAKDGAGATNLDHSPAALKMGS